MGDFQEQSGVVIDREVWGRAEKAAREIIGVVQPSVKSEERRKNVVDYVQSVLKGCLGCEVFPFGSVPLKTYLPDGDIDLTAFCAYNAEETFANDVYTVLETEDRNPAAQFVVKDVQYINAEVKLVKCLVQNIVVDISFNQIGGFCTLCFLEEIDRLIGKNHLFKCSLILIKSWCYYESRILGAHHGLISTYALETLVLYIFHLFHSSLNGPLEVLHKFLDYFSKFDWENLCVSLTGHVHVGSFPKVTADKPETSGRELLLSDDFMTECVRKFSVPSKGTFTQKYLNIVDPLKENNNLGRSVSKGNFFRIRSAFLYGARKLRQILLQPEENLADEVRKFFTNTLDRHGTGQRPDVQDNLQLSDSNGFISEARLLFLERCQDKIHSHGEDSLILDDLLCESRVEHENIQEHRITEKRDDFWPREKMKPGGILHAPHLYFCKRLENGEMENGDLDEEKHTESSLACDNIVGENSMKLAPDLSGDVDCLMNNLGYARWWYDQGLRMAIHQSNVLQPNVSWNVMPDEVAKSRGLGTYFPTFPNHQSYMDRPSPVGRYPLQSKSPCMNGRISPTPSDISLQGGPFHQGIGRLQFSYIHENVPRQQMYRQPNGFIQTPETVFDYVLPLIPPPEAALLSEIESREGDSFVHGENLEPDFGVSDTRFSEKSYQLKDNEDFPALCT